MQAVLLAAVNSGNRKTWQILLPTFRFESNKIIIKDNTQMNRDPSRVMAHRGMLSQKPTSSMMVTISAGRVVSVSADSPEAVMMVEIIPWATLNSAVISSIPWVTAVCASTKRIKHLNTISGFFNSVKFH